MANMLTPGQSLKVNESLVSKNGKYHIQYEENGKVVIYDWSLTPPKPIWMTPTEHAAPGQFIFQATDGNLVVYNDVGEPVWDIGVTPADAGTPVMAVMQDDGNFVVYRVRPVWGSAAPPAGPHSNWVSSLTNIANGLQTVETVISIVSE